MSNAVNFKIKGLNDPISEVEKEYSRISFSDYKTQSPIYTRSEREEKKQEYLRKKKLEQEGKQEENTPKQATSNPSIPNTQNQNQPDSYGSINQYEGTPEALGGSEQGIPAKARKEAVEKPESKPKIPYHMTLTPEELLEERERATNRFCPKGTISDGLTGLQKDAAELMENLIRWMVYKDGLVDDYFYIDEKRKNAILDKREMMADKENKERDKELAKEREGKIMEIAKAIEDMELKVPEEEAKRDLRLLVKMKDENPELDVKKMNKEEKDLFNNLIKPMAKEVKENDLDLSHFTDQETQDKIEELYGKHKSVSLKKEAKKEKGMSMEM